MVIKILLILSLSWSIIQPSDHGEKSLIIFHIDQALSYCRHIIRSAFSNNIFSEEELIQLVEHTETLKLLRDEYGERNNMFPSAEHTILDKIDAEIAALKVYRQRLFPTHIAKAFRVSSEKSKDKKDKDACS